MVLSAQVHVFICLVSATGNVNAYECLSEQSGGIMKSSDDIATSVCSTSYSVCACLDPMDRLLQSQ